MRALARLRLQRLGIVAIGVLDLAPPLAIVGAEQIAQDREQPRRQVRAGLERSILAIARNSVSCTRSSARSALPLSDIAKARKFGTAAKMSSRRQSVRGISQSLRFCGIARPWQPSDRPACGSGPRIGPAPPGERRRRTSRAADGRSGPEFRYSGRLRLSRGDFHRVCWCLRLPGFQFFHDPDPRCPEISPGYPEAVFVTFEALAHRSI